MVDDRRDLEDPDRAEPRHIRDRYSRVNSSPDKELRTVFLQLGVDLWSQDSIDDYNRALDWARSRARRSEEFRTSRRKAIWNIVVGFLVALATTVGAWLISRLPNGHS